MRGQTLAEFALVVPVFLLLVLGLFDVGRAVFIYNGLTNAVREGARLAIVNQNKDMILERAQAMAFGVGIETDSDSLTSFWRQLPNSDDVTDNDACPADGVPVGCIAVVEAEATWEAITPILGNLIGPLPLTARSEVAVEFKCPNPNIDEYDNPDGSECPRSIP
jgi:Flp pilus assembly protein TadG